MLAGDKSGELISTGESITLGEYSSFINNHDTSKSIEFGLNYSLNQDAKQYREKHSTDLLFGNKNIRSIDVSYASYENAGSIAWFSFECKGIIPVFTVKRFRHEGYIFDKAEGYKNYIINRNKIDVNIRSQKNKIDTAFSSNLGTKGSINLPLICLNSNIEDVNDYSEKISDDVVELFNTFRYLGPLRSSPKRFYAKGFEEAKNGKGKNNLGLDLIKQGNDVVDGINKRLADFDIPYKLSVEDLGNKISGSIVALELEDLRSGARITPMDVGFGIGQVLPIILEAEVSKNKTIFVEQPEIHLHPKLQAHMADLFIDSVDKEKGNNQWVIETHSEALMLRLQRRIRTGKISKDLVSVLYVDVGEDGARVTKLPLDDDGDFMAHWPNGFFEERFDEMTGE
jgi:hypothetical protein